MNEVALADPFVHFPIFDCELLETIDYLSELEVVGLKVPGSSKMTMEFGQSLSFQIYRIYLVINRGLDTMASLNPLE